MRWDWVSTTPFRGIALNQEGEARMRWLTDAEEARDWWAAAAPGCAISSWWDSTPDCAGAIWWDWQRSWLHEQGTTLVVPRQLVKAKKATVMIPLTHTRRDDHSRGSATGRCTLRVHALGGTRLLPGTSEYGGHSRGEAGAVAGRGVCIRSGIPSSAAWSRRDGRCRKWRPWRASRLSR